MGLIGLAKKIKELNPQCNLIFVRLMFQQGDFLDVNYKKLNRGCENPAGNEVNIRIEKSKVCRSDRRLGYYTLNYLQGIDYINDMIDVLLQLGGIIQAGSYFTLADIGTGEILTDEEGKDIKIQGRSNLYKKLKENPELYELITKNISYN